MVLRCGRTGRLVGRSSILGITLLIIFGLGTPYADGNENTYDILIASGRVLNQQGKGIEGVRLAFLLDDHVIAHEEEIVTSRDGTFEATLRVTKGRLPGGKVCLEANRHSYESPKFIGASLVTPYSSDQEGPSTFLAWFDGRLERAITPGFWVAAVVLLGVYVLIGLEIVHRTLAAMLGAAVMLFVTYTAGEMDSGWAVLTFEEASRCIDMNVILLLMAMMIIVGVLKRTGVFQWLAFKAFQVTKGNAFGLVALLMFITAFISAFLDNVTTMLLVFPVTFQICRALQMDPVPVLIPCAFASNVGGTATLIGDPPNIMIGSYAKLTFLDFVNNLSLICLVAQVAATVYFLLWNRKDYSAGGSKAWEVLTRESSLDWEIADRGLLNKGLSVLGLTILMFLVHGILHMEPSIAAMVGAVALMIVGKINIVEMLEKEIEWPTLVFFMMLFVVVAGAEQTGLIEIIAQWVGVASGGSLAMAIVVVLWVSALLSAVIDNIPFTATMLPIVSYLNQTIPGAETGVLWWALALGACLGGNGTMIGASANVVTVGLLDKAGYRVSFMRYMRLALPPMFITVAICMIWLLFLER
jgi:Na+/H+ antiporter NhaD/arsenite permease-like protein